MNKFTIEADGEKYVIDQLDFEYDSFLVARHYPSGKDYFTSMQPLRGEKEVVSAYFNILYKAYEQLREAPEKMTAQRDTLRTVKDEWRDLLRSRMDATPQPARKIVQVSVVSVREGPNLHALCNDGTLWAFYGSKWHQLPPIPQEDDKHAHQA
jgi:hypothetical protein